MTVKQAQRGAARGDPPRALPQETFVAIIGSGFSGLGMAVRLKDDGIEDFVVLERADDVGGTWRDNSYPGATCDVPSQLYSFSFALNPDWSRSFSSQPEILDYLRRCTDEYGLRPHVYLRHEVGDARWDEAAGRWVVTTPHGIIAAQVLVSAAGPLSDPTYPAIDGLDTLAGKLFHSCAWDHEHDLTGERVAVVGTGASAIQVIPAIQPRVRSLHVFQRTPPWVVPRGDRAFTRAEKALFRHVPAIQRGFREAIYAAREAYVFGFTVDTRLMRGAQRVARRHLRQQVQDPALRTKLEPSYTIGCKRILLSDDYYPALTRPNVELVTDPIARIAPHAVVTDDGTAREVDTIVCATGFLATHPPIAERIRGVAGHTLAREWTPHMRAYKGTTVSGFPNLFLLLGPNTGGGHTSVVLMAEAQLAYTMGAIRFLRHHGAVAVDVRPEAMERYNDAVQERMRDTVWLRGGCASWYLDEHGRNTTLWPSFTAGFRRQTRRFDRYSYRVDARPRQPAAPGREGSAGCR